MGKVNLAQKLTLFNVIIVPPGVEHRPVAPEEVYLLLLEPNSTLNTGNVMDGKTAVAEWI